MDRVEGALIRFIINTLLLLLGITEVGLSSETSSPTSFRITKQGSAFLKNQPIPTPANKTPFLRAGNNFQVQVPVQGSLYDRFQLARFATLDRREENRVVYIITQASVGRALRNGIEVDQMVAFLARATNNQTPLKVVETLRAWGKRQGATKLERVTLLRLKQESLGQELLQHPSLGSLLGEMIGPTAILVPAENFQEVRRILIELGYLTDSE